MSKVPRISVVTPSYNQGRYVGRTVESVLSQAGEFEVEYFVNDGGSTDESVGVIEGYARRVEAVEYPVACRGVTMRWKSGRDRGQSDAINQGLRQATGDYVCWINSDDELPPGALAAVARAFAEHPGADFVNGDGEVIDEEGRVQWRWLSRPYDYRVLSGYHGWWNDFTNYVMQQATYWRRSVLDRIGYLDESFHYGMDIEYWLRAGRAGMRWVHVPENLGRFRLIAGTKSLSSATAFWEDYLEIFRRHRGVRSMHRYFAYYHYNLAREHGMDLEAAGRAAAKAMRRWEGLDPAERDEVGRQERRGFARACGLLASELYRDGDAAGAEEVFARGRAAWDAVVPGRHQAAYLARRAVGRPISLAVDRRLQQLAKVYRAVRYDYRYRRRGE